MVGNIAKIFYNFQKSIFYILFSKYLRSLSKERCVGYLDLVAREYTAKCPPRVHSLFRSKKNSK